jgi:GMP synthase (glutamine-hydrolysing)
MKTILLIQFRTDISAEHEKNCFCRYFEKEKDFRLRIINVFKEKINFSFPQKIIGNSAGVILGGSGEFCFSGNKKEKEKMFRQMLKKISPFVKHLLKNDFPTLGICFGHQMLGYFLGEKLIKDKNQAESGTFLVYLTKEGKTDAIFSGIPSRFFAQFGHQDSLNKLPKEAMLLAKTKRCKVAAFKYKSKIYGVQFHPELGYNDMIFRFKLYPEYWQKRKKIGSILKPSPFVWRVIKNFLKVC